MSWLVWRSVVFIIVLFLGAFVGALAQNWLNETPSRRGSAIMSALGSPWTAFSFATALVVVYTISVARKWSYWKRAWEDKIDSQAMAVRTLTSSRDNLRVAMRAATGELEAARNAVNALTQERDSLKTALAAKSGPSVASMIAPQGMEVAGSGSCSKGDLHCDAFIYLSRKSGYYRPRIKLRSERFGQNLVAVLPQPDDAWDEDDLGQISGHFDTFLESHRWRTPDAPPGGWPCDWTRSALDHALQQATTVAGPAPTVPRVYTALAPDELCAALSSDKHTHMQMEALAKNYCGQWMHVAGRVFTAAQTGRNGVLHLSAPRDPRVMWGHVYLQFDEAWLPKLLALHRGDSVEVEGQIERADSFSILLSHCEIK